jgi:hypothetical protein
MPTMGEGPDLVRLEPNLLAISCERIKHELLRALGETDQWRGAIRIELHPAQNRNETIQIASTHYSDGWSYRMDLPDRMEVPRLIDAVVQTLLLEMANRTSTGRSAEIPAWLTYGLAQQLRQDAVLELVLRPPSRKDGSSFDGLTARTDRSWSAVDTTAERAQKMATDRGVRVFGSVADATASGDVSSLVMANPLAKAHEELRAQPPLTLDELSWPGEDELLGPSAAAYRNSAQLLVCDLARLPDGRSCLRAFVDELSQHFNWQMAFLKAFHSQFDTQRDLEKWWALKVENFTERDLTQTWPDDESWRKLEEIIRPPVEVRTAADEMPLRTEITLQGILQGFEFVRQGVILQDKIQQFMLLRVRVSQKLVPLVDAYRQALQDYLKKRQKIAVPKLAKGIVSKKLDQLTMETVRVLNGLDTRLEEMRPKDKQAVPEQNDTASVLTNP